MMDMEKPINMTSAEWEEMKKPQHLWSDWFRERMINCQRQSVVNDSLDKQEGEDMKLSELEGMTYSEIVRTAEGRIAESEERMGNMSDSESYYYGSQAQAFNESLRNKAQAQSGLKEIKFNPDPSDIYKNMFESFKKKEKEKEEFHAKQQYADFVKAAMQGLLANPNFKGDFNLLKVDANEAAIATLEEMTRRCK